MLNEIEQLCKKIGKDLATVQKNGGVETQWPFLIPEVEEFIKDEFIEKLRDILDKIDVNNLKQQKINYPSILSQYVVLIHSAKILPLEKRIKIIQKIIEIQKYLRKDYLCEKNNQLIGFDISKYIQEKETIQKQQIKQISSLLYSFYERIYPTLMRLGYEYHGPYIHKDKKYIVKEYFYMSSFYNKKIPVFPWNNLKIIEEYSGDITIDYFGHVFGDYTIKEVFLYIDDKHIEDTKQIFTITKEKYLELLKQQQEYQTKTYAIELTNGIFWSLDRNNNTYSPSKELLEKLESFKLFYPKEKIIASISSKPIEVLEKEIFNSFYSIFKE